MRTMILWRLITAIDVEDFDRPGERTIFAVVGLRSETEVGLRLCVWGCAVFILMRTRKAIIDEK